MLNRAMLFFCFFLLTSSLLADDTWPQFRGPTGDGRVPVCHFPDTWDMKKNIAWQSELPGAGWSSPVIWGDRVYVTCTMGDASAKVKGFAEGARDMRSMPFGGRPKAPQTDFRWQILCLDRATGKPLWQKECAKQKPSIPAHPSNTYATETPTTDGERVYAVFGPIGLVCCLDRTGKELWRKTLPVGNILAGFGTGSSPILVDGRLILQRDSDEKSSLVALDAKTGKDLWTVERTSRSSWSTPYLWRLPNRTELIVGGSGKIMSHDPANGKVLWEMGGVPASFTATPVGDKERLYFGTASPTSPDTFFAINAGATGDITLPKGEKSSASVAWVKTRLGAGMPSPLVHEGRLYLAGSTFLSCIDAKTGERIYRERLPAASSVAASPWIAGDRLFVLDETGQTFVLETGPKFKVLHVNKVEGLFWSTPSMAGDTLFLRAADRLYCIRK